MSEREGRRRRTGYRSAAEAREAAARYEAVAANDLNDWLVKLLPEGRGCILDVGAGSGRDAAWLASLGHDVLAVEPDAAMRGECRRHHPHNTFQVQDDALPDLTATFRTGLAFDFILLNAVWMFIGPGDRERAFRKLVTLLKPGGAIAVTLRRGPVEVERGMHPVRTEEIEHLARRHGAYVEHVGDVPDHFGRHRISWTRLLVRVPDDGAGALPLLRRIILNDDKSSTYKLALIRTICRVAHSAPGLAREVGDFVDIPLGIVSLFWLRMYLPLLRRDIPQNPRNTSGFRHLSFAREGLADLGDISPHDLRAGGAVGADRRRAMHAALGTASSTIARMPATHLTYSDGTRIFPVERKPAASPPNAPRLDAAYLWAFGSLSVPGHLWRAMQRYAVWIEPALVEEWIALSRKYASTQDRSLDAAVLRACLDWQEPQREAGDAKRRAANLLGKQPLYCVWTGRRLLRNNLDIDHCFPWSAWPCGDLWNLMPANRQVNQRQKRNLLPADETLRNAKDRILDWWDAGYCGHPALGERFRLEARARLPAIGSSPDLEDLFAAVGFQRLRLCNDQQIPEWNGPQ